MSTLDWIAATFGPLILTLPWTWPIAETFHFIGLCMMLGGLIVIDLRLLGWNRLIPTVASHDILPIIYIGLAINTITGLMFFVGDPHRYFINIGFQLNDMHGTDTLRYAFENDATAETHDEHRIRLWSDQARPDSQPSLTEH